MKMITNYYAEPCNMLVFVPICSQSKSNKLDIRRPLMHQRNKLYEGTRMISFYSLTNNSSNKVFFLVFLVLLATSHGFIGGWNLLIH